MAGFEDGKIRWDDRDWLIWNSQQQYLPEGKFDDNTEIHYCCRKDLPDVVEIKLPNTKPFYLMQKGTYCNRVQGMKPPHREKFRWDNSNWSRWGSRGWQSEGNFPSNDYQHEDNILSYCYYEPDPEYMEAKRKEEEEAIKNRKITVVDGTSEDIP